MPNPFRSLAGIFSPRNLIGRVADGLETFADALAAVAEEQLPGETPREKRQRVRAERRQVRTRRRSTRRPIVPRVPAEPTPATEEEEEAEPEATLLPFGIPIRGDLEIGDEDNERHTYATLDEALAAYTDLHEAGVPEDLLAIIFHPERRFPYSLIVRPSR